MTTLPCALCGEPVAVTDPALIPACERCIEAAVISVHALADALNAWVAAPQERDAA